VSSETEGFAEPDGDITAALGAALAEPGRIAQLPRDKHHRPVPWFVAWVNGAYDFRVIRAGAIREAQLLRLCWVCGVTFQRQEDRAFVIGPMCAVNRVSAEPPSHRDCAVYSATNCPFLATPGMVRRERHMPEGAANPAGTMIRRNPGVALVWVTGYRAWKPFQDDGGGTLFNIGEPKEALWFAHGRPARRAEVLASINSGLPILREMAEADGAEAVAELGRMHERALAHVPGAAS
jgi:hypothetical protein